jgi:hypothetical protein
MGFAPGIPPCTFQVTFHGEAGTHESSAGGETKLSPAKTRSHRCTRACLQHVTQSHVLRLWLQVNRMTRPVPGSLMPAPQLICPRPLKVKLQWTPLATGGTAQFAELRKRPPQPNSGRARKAVMLTLHTQVLPHS